MKSYIQHIQSLDGDSCERWFETLIKQKLQFQDYFPSSGQVKLIDLDPTCRSGQHLEIDGVLLINRTT